MCGYLDDDQPDIPGRQPLVPLGEDPADTAGVLAQRNQRLSARNVGLIVDEMAAHLPQEAVVLEYVSTNWL